jgi:imidazolonepropionase-like amidohydrolase
MRSVAVISMMAVGCGASSTAVKEPKAPELNVVGPWVDPEAHVPSPRPEPTAPARAAPPPLVIEGATIMTAAGQRIHGGTIVVRGGAIEYVGQAPPSLPEDARVIDGRGRFVTPGLIDTHSHIGVYAAPNVDSHSDGNEMTAPVTAEARAEYGYWPQDPAITRAQAGGVTIAQILPGSANLIGGRGATVVMRPARSVNDVAVAGAPPTLKMACGENPKRVHGDKGGPQTRMGEYAQFRATFQQAAEYEARKRHYDAARALWLTKKQRAAELDRELERAGKKARVPAEPAPEPPARDAKLETLAGVLRGEVLVQVHCYRADEMREMIRIADQFGFAIRSFHHALEAYKIRDVLAARDIAVSTWADWWGFKMEAFDGIPENAALVAAAGARAVIHSDSSIGIQRLNQEAAKAMYAGQAAGIPVTEDEALRWITANPAWVLGLDQVVGTLEPAKRADVVLWSAHPFSVYARADLVVSAGEIVYERRDGLAPTDFELGNSALGHAGAPRPAAPDRADAAASASPAPPRPGASS